MFYLTALIKDGMGWLTSSYRIFDTYTHSTIICSKDDIRMLAKQGFEFANFEIRGGRIVINKWPLNIPSHIQGSNSIGHKYIVTSIDDNGAIKIITDNNNEIIRSNEHGIMSLIASRLVLNCAYCNESEQIKYYDVHRIHNDAQFVMNIQEQYNRYVSKAALMGMDVRFNYEIEDNQVILTKYIGTCRNIILPKFVRFIRESAFRLAVVESIVLNDGIIGIGQFAFINSLFHQIVIPNTIRFMGNLAFDYGTILKQSNGDIYYSNNKHTISDRA